MNPNAREAIIEVLDRMVSMGWARRYGRNAKDQFVVDWTDEGGKKIAQLCYLAEELGIVQADESSEILWRAVLVLATLNLPLNPPET